MASFTRIQSVIARINALEGHAAAIQRAFRGEALKTEAQIVLATLRVAADDLRGEPVGSGKSEQLFPEILIRSAC
jgi:hypothetical protein